MDYILNFITSFDWHSSTAIIFYWVPVVLCVVGFLFDFREMYKIDLNNYQAEYYIPKLTVGAIVGRMVLSFVPICNFIASIRHAFTLITDIIATFSEWLNIPLIRHKPKHNAD